ncbi:MAG: DUF2206 domain-containing protein [Candidatus Bathyarchaeota archaeon]|nr:DUF2206 domain-containing protein [Candidatus Bathyarchaeota archaeon]
MLAQNKSFFAFVVFLQVALLFTIFFEVSLARQVLGFVYLTFVPGFAILTLMRSKFGGLETALFIVGISIAFLMGTGFLLNLLGPLLGISEPLSLDFVLCVTVVFVLICLLLGRRGYHKSINLSVGRKEITVFGFVLGVILFLSILGVLLVSVSSNFGRPVLFIMLIAIAALVVLAASSRKLVSPSLYPIILFVVSLALLFHVSFFSSKIFGGDIFGEYALFRETVNSLHWDSSAAFNYNAMLSVTILPTIYSVVLGLDGVWLFKIVYPLIFALVPLGLYQFFKYRVHPRIAFFSVFFFISNFVFFTELVQLARQMIGELFYILLLITLFSDDVKGSAKWILFSMFSFGLIVSHYALAYIFFGFISIVWIISYLRRCRSNVTAGMVILFGVLAFSWFIYVSSAATFAHFINALDSVRSGLFTEFFNPQSRSSQVLQAVGVSGISTFWHTIGRFIFYVTEGLIVIGILTMLFRKRRSFFSDAFNVFVFCNIFLLGMCIVLPNFAGTFNVSRFYHVTLFFLAPLCILGGIYVLQFLSRSKFKEKYLSLIIVLVVLVPFFFFQTGFVYELAKEESSSLPLSAYRFNTLQLAQSGVITEPEVAGARWLSKFAGLNMTVYEDINSGSLFSYVGLPTGVGLSALSQDIVLPSDCYVYFRAYNLETRQVFTYYGLNVAFNVTQISPDLDTMNILYSSSSCEIYEVP